MLFIKSSNLTYFCDPEILHSYKTLALDFDAANRLTAVKNIPEAITTSYSYDNADNLTTITDAEQKVTTLTFDNSNRKLSKTYPDNQVINYSYDPNDNLTNIDLPNSTNISYNYDALNRQTSQSYTGALGTASVDFTLDGNGNIEAVSETIGEINLSVSMQYDNLDRLTLITNHHGNSLQYAYDANGNRKTLQDPKNTQSNYNFDDLNRLSQAAVVGTGAFDYSYNTAGLLSKIEYPNQGSANFTYDSANRIDVITDIQMGVPVAIYDYNYDLNGNRIQVDQTNINTNEIISYSYDDADRLTQVIYPNETNTYILDKVGNRTTEIIDDGASTLTRTFGFNTRDQLTSVTDTNGMNITYQYDNAGNQTQKDESGSITTFNYSPRQRINSIVQNGTQISYTYDYLGNRLSKESNGQMTLYNYDQTSLLYETNNIGNVLAKYHYGSDRVLAETRNGTNQYIFHDALRTPIAITNQDGSIQNRLDYDVWGAQTNETSTDEHPFGFTGYQQDEDTDLYYAKARYYDSFTGRFLREDPFQGDVNKPPTLHRYLYANGNPTFYVDPTGLYGEEGHYYTTYFVALTMGYNADEARQLAVFSQFPDEVEAYDAVALQARATGDVFLNSNRQRMSDLDEPYWTQGRIEQRERTAVHQSTHALTGSDSALETKRAVRSVLRSDDLAVSGVAIHRLADSFAHRRIDDESRLYITGDGHRVDGHDPDQISLRPRLYENYVNTLATTLAVKRGLSPNEALSRINRANQLAGVVTSRLSTINPHENRAVSPEDMMILIRIADTENWLQGGALTLDEPENHNIVTKLGFFELGIAAIFGSREISSSMVDIKGWYESKFSIQDQGLNINGQKNLTEAVLKDISVLIGINDYRALKNLDGDVVFDLVDQRLRYAINENIKSYDNEVSLEKIDQNTSVVIE